MSRISQFAVCAILLSVRGLAQLPAGCEAVLIPTEEQASSDYRQMQAFMYSNAEQEYDRLSKVDSNTRNADASFKLFGAEYGESQNRQEFQEKVRHRLKNEGFQMSQSDARSYARRSLTDKQVDGWSQCISLAKTGSLLLTPKNIEASGFALLVTNAFPPGVGSGSLQLKVTGGTIDHRTDLSEALVGAGAKTYFILANANTPRVRVIGNMPGYSDDILVDLHSEPNPASAFLTQMQAFARPPGGEYVWRGHQQDMDALEQSGLMYLDLAPSETTFATTIIFYNAARELASRIERRADDEFRKVSTLQKYSCHHLLVNGYRAILDDLREQRVRGSLTPAIVSSYRERFRQWRRTDPPSRCISE